MNQLDPRLLTILSVVAEGELCSDDGDNYCPYGSCGAWDPSARYGQAVHDAECPVTLARQVLAERGRPLLMYQVDWEFFHAEHTWKPASPSYILAFSKEQVQAYFPEHTDPSQPGILRRNVMVTLLGTALELLAPAS